METIRDCVIMFGIISAPFWIEPLVWIVGR
jgi:hypothetical protein